MLTLYQHISTHFLLAYVFPTNFELQHADTSSWTHASSPVQTERHLLGLLFGVDEKLLTQHISGPVTKYKLLYVSNQGRAGARAWARG